MHVRRALCGRNSNRYLPKDQQLGPRAARSLGEHGASPDGRGYGVRLTGLAEEIDVDFCTNFYPELCLGPDGEIDPGTFPYLIDGTPIPGYTDPAYNLAVLTLERHRGGDDLDGNGVPDSPEIAVCGEAGCLPEAMAESEVTEPDALVINMCKGNPESASSVEVDISEGMNPKGVLRCFTLSSPTVNYMGSYPSGKVTVTVGPGGLRVRHASARHRGGYGRRSQPRKSKFGV